MAGTICFYGAGSAQRLCDNLLGKSLSECGCAGLPADEQRVMFGGRQLPDGAALAAAGVADEDTLYILARLLGGGKKRKKKTYTKPKKQKHKHKKIKMRVLKFFKARRCPPGGGTSLRSRSDVTSS